MMVISIEEQFLLLGILMFLGYGSAIVLKKYGIPNVVAYLLVGFFTANTILTDINFVEDLHQWYIISETLALGLIGYKIGTELKLNLLRAKSKIITILLIAEAGGAFIIVFSVVYLFWGNFLLSIILAGLATATAPAATLEVLRKLKAKGPLTSKLQWLLAFDDVLAVVIIEGILVFVSIKLGGVLTVGSYFSKLFQEIGIAILFGFLVGYILNQIIEKTDDDLIIVKFSIGVIIFVIGFSFMLHTSVILATMSLGATMTNLNGNNYLKSGTLLSLFVSPILIIFFILVGARVSFADFSPFPVLALFYLIARSIGKIGGTFIGANFLESDKTIRNNLGFGLLAQGGVAIGLASLANEILADAGEGELGLLIITTITISTIFSEIIGAFLTKFAVQRAGEMGKLTERELLKQDKKFEKSWKEYPDSPIHAQKI